MLFQNISAAENREMRYKREGEYMKTLYLECGMGAAGDMLTAALLELLEKTDTLLFDPNELDIVAEDENLDEVQAFVEERLADSGCSMKAQMQIAVVVEEVFVNIAHYAYAPDTGRAKLNTEISGDPRAITITFTDRGIPYDPLAKPDPDLSLPASEREIGGLGILMTKKFMDDVSYEYRDGQNILSLKKNL